MFYNIKTELVWYSFFPASFRTAQTVFDNAVSTGRQKELVVVSTEDTIDIPYQDDNVRVYSFLVKEPNCPGLALQSAMTCFTRIDDNVPVILRRSGQETTTEAATDQESKSIIIFLLCYI